MRGIGRILTRIRIYLLHYHLNEILFASTGHIPGGHDEFRVHFLGGSCFFLSVCMMVVSTQQCSHVPYMYMYVLLKTKLDSLADGACHVQCTAQVDDALRKDHTEQGSGRKSHEQFYSLVDGLVVEKLHNVFVIQLFYVQQHNL